MRPGRDRLLGWLPRWLQGPISQDVADAIGDQLDAIDEQAVADQLFVTTATWGLDLWERDYGIPTIASDSYDTRRARILAKRAGVHVRNDEEFIGLTRTLVLPAPTCDPIPTVVPGEYAVEKLCNWGEPSNFADVEAGLAVARPAHEGLYVAFWDDVNGLTLAQMSKMHLVALSVLTLRELSGNILLRDAFNRADSASSMGTADIGGAWAVGNLGDVATLPTWGLTSGLGYLVATGTGSVHHAWLESGKANVRVGVDVITPSPTNGSMAGILFRRVDASNFWVARLNNNTNLVELRRTLAGTTTTVQSATGPTVGAGGTARLEVEAIDDEIEVFVNGTSVLSQSASDMQTGTKHGIARSSASGAYRFDNYICREAR